MLAYTKKQIAQLDAYFVEPRNLVDLFERSAAKWCNRNAMGSRNPHTGQFEWITYAQLARRIDHLRGGLKKRGFKKGDTAAVILSNSVEWFVVENAVHGLGGQFVAMYEKELTKTWEYILRDAQVKYLFVRDEAAYAKIAPLRKKIRTLREIFIVHGSDKNGMLALEELGEEHPVASYKPAWHEIANIIYTSGTTGDPKGVVLSHGNLTACSQSGYNIFPQLTEESISLAILPWAHSYGLSAELHNFLQFGGAMGINSSVDALAEELLLVRPNFIIAVPRVFNKIYDGIQNLMKQKGGAAKFLFDAAVAEAKKCRDGEPTLKLKILDRIVFAKIRARFGGRLEGSLTASAVMNPEIALFFKDIGIPTYDCYGMTETSPAITMNSPLLGNRYGSVGRCVANMHVVIDRSRVKDESEDGEIIAYGPHVMMGYLNKPKETAKVMTKDMIGGCRGIRTGDQGHIDADRFLYVTGRFKDEYKLSNGKYIHPESIETDMKLLPWIANAMVHGDGKTYNVSVVALDFDALRKHRETAKFTGGGFGKTMQKPELLVFLRNAITAHLKKSFAAYEIPKKFIFTGEDFTIENGMLTQTMKVKRREVLKVYGERIQALYDED